MGEKNKKNKSDIIRILCCIMKLAIIILILISLLNFFYIMLTHPIQESKLRIPEIKDDKVEEAQKEMEILSQFLMSNAQIIIWIRGISLTIWIGIIGYILKEYYMGDGYSKRIIIQKKIDIIILLSAILLLAFLLELPIQMAQASLTNRVYQLDTAINKKIFSTCPNELQEIFIMKNKFNPNPDSFPDIIVTFSEILYAGTFLGFYLPMLIILVLLCCAIRDQR